MAESSIPRSSLASIPVAELDAYIADLIVQKSKANEAQPQQPSDDGDGTVAPRIPNTNKRFLTSVIRNVEGHNQALLRQQAREERLKAAKGRRVDEAGASNDGPSGLRGWSDDEEVKVEQEGYSSGRKHVDEDGPTGLSRKMDKYFERNSNESEASDSQSPSRQDKERANRARENDERRDSKRRSDRRERGSGRYHGSKSSSSSHHKHRRDDSKRSRHHDKHRSDDGHKHSNPRSSQDHRSRRYHDSADESEGRERRRGDSSWPKHRHRERSHRSRRDQERKRSASPIAEPPKKVREWDMGKDSLAF